jgi:hypothetical protein
VSRYRDHDASGTREWVPCGYQRQARPLRQVAQFMRAAMRAEQRVRAALPVDLEERDAAMEPDGHRAFVAAPGLLASMNAPPSRRSRGDGKAGDGVPEDVVAQARAAYARRGPEPVAEIVTDSADQDGAGADRVLRFEYPGALRLDLWVGSKGGRRSLRGRVEPPQDRVELELEGAGISVAEHASSGTFAFEGVPRGIMRLRLATEGAVLVTAWFLA